jgi:hypothetical protein
VEGKAEQAPKSLEVTLQAFTTSIIPLLKKDTNILVKVARRNAQANHYAKVIYNTILSAGPQVSSNVVILKNYDTVLRLVDANGEHKYDRKETSTRDLIDTLNARGKKVIILVVGRSKWGDQYSRSTLFYQSHQTTYILANSHSRASWAGIRILQREYSHSKH